MTEFRLHPRLAADSHPLASVTTGRVLLHRNAALPWFIFVPDVSETELLDVEPALRAAIRADVDTLAVLVRERYAADKLNIAAIGNVVEQLHIHVVARFVDDPCWPAPVWGNLPAGGDYSPEQVEALARAVRAAWPDGGAGP